MSDIIERLRDRRGSTEYPLMQEAADEIERLTVAVKISDTIIKELMLDNERLRAALREIADLQGHTSGEAEMRARAALEGKP